MNSTLFSNIPTNRNFLSPIPYQLVVRRLPNVDFFIQQANLPGVSSSPVMQPTMFSNIPLSGVKLDWKPLTITFKVDEELANWQEIFNWMKAINEAEDLEDYGLLAKNSTFSGLNVTSEMTLVIMDGMRQPNFNIYFHDAFPLDLTDIDFDVTKTDVEYVTVSATFAYSTYDIEKVI